MKKAFWIYQISNLMSLLLFVVLAINFTFSQTFYWIYDYMLVYFAIIFMLIFSKRWALHYDLNAKNPLTSITICKNLQYAALFIFLVFVAVKIIQNEMVIFIATICSIICMFLAYILTFVLSPKVIKDKNLIDDIDFE